MNTTGAAAARGVSDGRYEEIVPSSDWTEDADCHCLLIDLPGFKKQEVKLQIDNHGHVIASGERKVSESKRIRFRQLYKVPETANITDTGGKFEDGILYVIIPKKKEIAKNEAAAPREETELQQNNNNNNNESRKQQKENEEEMKRSKNDDEDEKFHDAESMISIKWDAEKLLETVKEKIKENKRVILAAVFAFSLGVLVSHKIKYKGD